MGGGGHQKNNPLKYGAENIWGGLFFHDQEAARLTSCSSGMESRAVWTAPLLLVLDDDEKIKNKQKKKKHRVIFYRSNHCYLLIQWIKVRETCNL